MRFLVDTDVYRQWCSTDPPWYIPRSSINRSTLRLSTTVGFFASLARHYAILMFISPLLPLIDDKATALSLVMTPVFLEATTKGEGSS